MSQIIKSYLWLFLLIIGVYIFCSCTFANQQVIHAREYHNDILNELECSNLSSSVIENCISSTLDNTDYNITINKISDENDTTVAAEVILNYKYKIPLLNIKEDKQIRGIAR